MVTPFPTPRATAFLDEIRAEFPRFRIVPKSESLLSRAISVALRVLTAGAQKRFMTHYHTVIGNTLFVPDAWERTPDLQRLVTLRHERVHLRQRRRYGDGLLTFLYLVPFFPLGLAYGRACIEWEAYRETLAATLELRGVEAARSRELRSHIVSQFTGAAYGWMWPFPRTVGRWYDEALASLLPAAPRAADPSRETPIA